MRSFVRITQYKIHYRNSKNLALEIFQVKTAKQHMMFLGYLKIHTLSRKRSFEPDLEAVAQWCFYKIGVLRNFTKLTGKHMWQTLSFLIKLQAWGFIKKGTLAQVFSCEFCKISKNTFLHRSPPVTGSADSFFLHVYGDVSLCNIASLIQEL